MPTSLNKYLDRPALDETVVNIRQIVEGLEEEMQNLPYAKPDGLYPDMTVGAVIGADETTQWAQRESTGSGTATVRSVQGAAVVWNQISDNSRATVTTNGITFTNNGDGSITVSGTATDVVTFNSVEHSENTPKQGHVYLLKGCPANGSPSTYKLQNPFMNGSQYTDFGEGRIYTDASVGTRILTQIYIAQGATVDNLVFRPQLFDLTAIFGAGNEPATVEEFEAMYPESYYPYSAPTLKPVRIAGIESTDANGDAFDGVEWETQTLRAAGNVRDELTADELVTRVGVVDLGTLNYTISNGRFLSQHALDAAPAKSINVSAIPNVECAPYTAAAWNVLGTSGHDKEVGAIGAQVMVADSTYTTAADFKAAMSGVLLFYELATPTTTPISPALPMTYRVEQGGTEAIIVPDGEVSAAPVITAAEPVNMSTELARIWAAIESLGYTRNAAQLSRPVSLTYIGSIDEVQKDTTEIDTVKEVKE